MTDRELVAKKLAEIETYVHELRTMSRLSEIEHDVREERFVAHTLQLAIQAVLDVASHIVSDGRLGEPATNHELFDILARHGRLDPALAPTLRKMTGFRNLLVHEYARVDLTIVRNVVEHQLEDLLVFVRAIRESMD